MNLNNGKPSVTAVDDAGFYGHKLSMEEWEKNNENHILFHTSVMLSMVNCAEYIKGLIKHRYNQLPNNTKKDAAESLHKVVSNFDKLSAYKA